MRKDAAENRQAIVEVATALIAQMGADVSLRTIAKEAGVGVATASRHFPDRNDLYRAVLERAADRMRDVVDRYAPKMPEDPEGAWRSAIKEMVAINFPAVAQEILPVLASHIDAEKQEFYLQKVRSLYRPLLLQAEKFGLFPRGVDAVNFDIGIIAISRPLPAKAEEAFAAERAWLVDVFINGLRDPHRAAE